MRMNVISRLVLPAFFVLNTGTALASDESLDAVISNHWDWVLSNTRVRANTVTCRAIKAGPT